MAQSATRPNGRRRPAKKNKTQMFSTRWGIDLPFMFLVLSLLAIGLVMLFSSSYAYALANDGNSYHYVLRQLLWALIGFAVMLFVSFFDYHKLRKWAPIVLLAITIVLLIYVLLTETHSTANRWIYTPFGTFQPSELAKFTMVLCCAAYMTRNQKKMETFKYGLVPYLGIACVMALLLVAQPHISATMIVLGLMVVMLTVGGTRPVYIILIIAGAALGLAALIHFEVLEYVTVRWEVFRDPFGYPNPDASHQTRQSLYAIGSGGLFGLGLGNSRQKYLYLPEPQNDFIFAVVCEELGLVGATLIILLFCALVWRGVTIARRAEDRFGSLLAVGLTAQVGIQAFLNVAVVSSMMPNTGISLPFFSYGGTSLVMLMAEMGLVLSVSRNARMDKA